MTTSLRLATVAIGTVLLTTGALADDQKPFPGIVLVAPAGYTATPTLVQQLQANLAYQLHHYALNGYVKNYHYYASQRLAKQLTAALAAAAAGNPGNPILKEDGTVAPVNPYVAAPGPVVSTPPGNTAYAGDAAAPAAAAGGDGGIPSSNPDTGIASSNPDTGIKSSNPDGRAGAAGGSG